MRIGMVLKHILSGVLYYSGLTDFFMHRDKRGIILCYHHVLPEGDERIGFLQPGMYVTSNTFEMHIRYLSEHFDFIGLEHWSKSLKNKQCIITFDDGWADNYEYAYPILKKHGVPATFFVTTNCIGSGRWPWPDRLSYYIHASSAHDVLLMHKKVLTALSKKLPSMDKTSIEVNNRFVAVEEIVSLVKLLSHEEIITFMRQIDLVMQAHNKKMELNRPWMTWDEISEMSSNNMLFGSHTHNHVILTGTSLKESREEIQYSRGILANKLCKPITTFCYPNGYYHHDIVSILEGLEFR
ncbi:MAG TPA: polysaccharide deacetylase family protein, partial [Syntrophorhabdus sp.]|nr:polysaccharide deacetylase family protein [Syntrophorhabdus sp.]